MHRAGEPVVLASKEPDVQVPTDNEGEALPPAPFGMNFWSL